MGILLSKNDIAYENHNFWWYYILSCKGFDYEKEINLDDAIKDVVDEQKYVPDFLVWYKKFCPENEADTDGYYENPNTISVNLKNNMCFTIEFHLWQTSYYLNDVYFGNQGGNFEAWFLSLSELLAFDKNDFLFLLLLPMLGIEASERKTVEALLADKLKHISIFHGQESYISKCMVNGLIIDGHFEQTEGIGTTSTQNHCVRNIKKYPRYINDVIALNKALSGTVYKDYVIFP